MQFARSKAEHIPTVFSVSILFDSFFSSVFAIRVIFAAWLSSRMLCTSLCINQETILHVVHVAMIACFACSNMLFVDKKIMQQRKKVGRPPVDGENVARRDM